MVESVNTTDAPARQAAEPIEVSFSSPTGSLRTALTIETIVMGSNVLLGLPMQRKLRIAVPQSGLIAIYPVRNIRIL